MHLQLPTPRHSSPEMPGFDESVFGSVRVNLSTHLDGFQSLQSSRDLEEETTWSHIRASAERQSMGDSALILPLLSSLCLSLSPLSPRSPLLSCARSRVRGNTRCDWQVRWSRAFLFSNVWMNYACNVLLWGRLKKLAFAAITWQKCLIILLLQLNFQTFFKTFMNFYWIKSTRDAIC